MISTSELDRIIRPLIADIIDQVIESSSGELPPTKAVIAEHIEDATATLRVAIFTHLVEEGIEEEPTEPPLNTEAIVVRGMN